MISRRITSPAGTRAGNDSRLRTLSLSVSPDSQWTGESGDTDNDSVRRRESLPARVPAALHRVNRPAAPMQLADCPSVPAPPALARTGFQSHTHSGQRTSPAWARHALHAAVPLQLLLRDWVTLREFVRPAGAAKPDSRCMPAMLPLASKGLPKAGPLCACARADA